MVAPIGEPPRKTAIPLFTSAVPVMISVESLVIWSVALLPVSFVMLTGTGTVGASVSIVTVKPVDAALVLPATSVALAVNW